MALMPQSFRTRLVVLCGGLGLLIGLPAYLYIDHVYAERLLEDRGEALHEQAVAVAAVIAENLNERRREVELLARTPLFRKAPLDSVEFQSSLERLQKSYPAYSWIGLTDLDGIVRASTGGLLMGADVSQRPWFTGGLKGPHLGDVHDAVLLSRLLRPEPDGAPIRFIDFSVPVLDDSGRLRGVLGAHAHWRWAGEVLQVLKSRDTDRGGLEYLIVNRQGRVIHPERDAMPLSLVERLRTQPVVSDRWGGQTEYVTTLAPVWDVVPEAPLGWQVVVRQPLHTVIADVAELRHAVLLFSLMAGLTLCLLAWWAAGRLSTPLEHLALQARRIEQGDESAELAITGSTREVVHLGEALRSMAATLIHRREALEASNHALEARVEERTAELARLNDELREQARRDALTGLPNRLAANERLREEFVRMKRMRSAYAVLVLDIDHFKRINDTHGHPAGDAVLRHVSGVLRGALRESDFVARFGGEEFLILLPVTPLNDAVAVGEKVRGAVESSPTAAVGAVTLSIGLAMADPTHQDEDVAVRAADALLYQAKSAGRNRLVAPKAA